MVSLERPLMNETIAGLVGGIYSAATGASLAIQALAGVWPHQASLAASAAVAITSFYLGRLSVRWMRFK